MQRDTPQARSVHAYAILERFTMLLLPINSIVVAVVIVVAAALESTCHKAMFLSGQCIPYALTSRRGKVLLTQPRTSLC
jgi:hypothetical protein